MFPVTKMDMDFGIIQFSRDLCTKNIDNLSVEEECKRNVLINEVSEKLNYFRDGFCSKLHKLYRNQMDVVMDTEEQFLRYAIPRCLKIIETKHYYFSLMLVAAFIQELVLYIAYKRNCYRFTSTAYKCFAAVFKRKFEVTFEEKGGWKGVMSFCQYVEILWNFTNSNHLPDILTGGQIAHKKRVYKLIKECDVQHNEHFELNEYELYLVTLDQDLVREFETLESPSDSDPDDSSLEVGQGSQEDNDLCPMLQLAKSEDEDSRYLFHLSTLSTSDSEFSSNASDSKADDESEPDMYDFVFRAKENASDSKSSVKPSDSKSDGDDSDCDMMDVFRRRKCSDEDADTQLRRKFPKQMGETKSERLCGWCNKMCYQYAKFFVTGHADSLSKQQTNMVENEIQNK